MAGHSQFANIKHRKGAQDAKRAKLFTKLLREITVAAKSGQPDLEFNPRLRNAVIEARSHNLPKDRVEAAIKKVALGNDGDNFEEIRYEGYGINGVALIVEALTDNRNRTASEVRSIFNKYGGAMGETNSVAFMFNHVGLIQYDAKLALAEEIFEMAITAGADDIESNNEYHIIICSPENLAIVRDNLSAKLGDPSLAKLHWQPKNTIELDLESAQKLFKMVDALEDCDDVQFVTGNYYISTKIMDKL
jgi:YebC/PmpR family DNA-binding regulatory protein